MKKIEIILMAMVLLLFTLGASQAYAYSSVTVYHDFASSFGFDGMESYNASGGGENNGNWMGVHQGAGITDWYKDLGPYSKVLWNSHSHELVIIISCGSRGSDLTGTTGPSGGGGSAAPVPPAVLLLGSGLIGLMLFRGRRRNLGA